jgi:hypothetical protein
MTTVEFQADVLDGKITLPPAVRKRFRGRLHVIVFAVEKWVAVGTALADRPPHRSGSARHNTSFVTGPSAQT